MDKLTKRTRISILTQIIEKEELRSQQDVISKLSECGIEITQSSLSRYLKEIKASRVPDGHGDYIYKLPPNRGSAQSTISDQLLSVEFAGPSMAVFRTSAGYANAVSALIDSRRLAPAAGTVSGDDTILMIIRDGYTRAQVAELLIREFPNIRDKFINR